MSIIKPSKGYYSLLQFVPDIERAEGVNVGVVLFAPVHNFLKARTTTDNDRVRRFFGSEQLFDLNRLKALKETFAERISFEQRRIVTREDFGLFVATRANNFLLTEPRPIKVFNPGQDLDKLFETLVGGRQITHQAKVKQRGEINRRFNRLIIERGIGGKVERKKKIEIPLLARAPVFPFYYENGQPNVVQTTVFEGETGYNINRACTLAFEGKGLLELPKPHKLNIIAAFGTNTNGLREQLEEILNEFQVDLYAEHEIERFADMVARTAH